MRISKRKAFVLKALKPKRLKDSSQHRRASPARLSLLAALGALCAAQEEAVCHCKASG